MLLSPRIHLKPLMQLCRRLATATAAGIEDRRIWRDEAQRGGPSQRAVAAQVSAALDRGESITDALAATGDFLPPMFKQLAGVGDRSGQLDRTYRRLAEHYEHALTTRREFLGGLAWPAIQLGIAVFVVGVVIWFTGAMRLKDVRGEPLDMFGLGLTGAKGLTIYATLVAAAVAAVLLLLAAMRRGLLWTRSLQSAALKLPLVGGALETLSMAQFTWALSLVFDTPMDLRKALPLALDATGNDHYRRLGPQVARSVGQGATIHAALAETGSFPQDFLDALEVGEQSGMLAETMQRQSKEYQERANLAVSVLAQALGYVVWAAVAVVLVVLIFRVMNFYTGTLESLTKPDVF